MNRDNEKRLDEQVDDIQQSVTQVMEALNKDTEQPSIVKHLEVLACVSFTLLQQNLDDIKASGQNVDEQTKLANELLDLLKPYAKRVNYVHDACRIYQKQQEAAKNN